MLSKEILDKLRELLKIQFSVTKHCANIYTSKSTNYSTKEVTISISDFVSGKYASFYRKIIDLNSKTAITELDTAIEELKKICMRRCERL